ncbi:FdhE protein [Desulfobaculum xiamenense]|uniref:FdhE protein n=1 Tax=Desulfobaculum xiamenense TaxID=995050 RepID=A0A846QHB1_9BACT|nr:formate dehydrogenase accessory protein FdhE [Desulfobaculum xiamenense]NJB66387.1 FdhE protein [Desulfobaculum xiamenense]
MPFDPQARLRLLDIRFRLLRERTHIPDVLANLVHDVHQRQITARAEANVRVTEDMLTPPEQRGPGIPLLLRERFPFDAELSARLFDEFIALLLPLSGPLADAARLIRDSRTDLDLGSLFSARLADDESRFALWAEKTPKAPNCMKFLIQSSMAPGLNEAAEQAAEGMDLEISHAPGPCPVCGSLPFITELRGKEGFRHATCSFCQTTYRIARLSCPFCGEDDMEKLAYFTAEGEDGYRVDVCDSCKMYIKCADFRAMDRKTMPLIDDLDSLTLDLLAAEEGYTRPTLSSLGF